MDSKGKEKRALARLTPFAASPVVLRGIRGGADNVKMEVREKGEKGGKGKRKPSFTARKERRSKEVNASLSRSDDDHGSQSEDSVIPAKAGKGMPARASVSISLFQSARGLSFCVFVSTERFLSPLFSFHLHFLYVCKRLWVCLCMCMHSCERMRAYSISAAYGSHFPKELRESTSNMSNKQSDNNTKKKKRGEFLQAFRFSFTRKRL